VAKVCVCVCQLSGRDARCLFQELQTDDHYTEFRSVAEPRWYVGFSKRGRRLRADSWNHVDGRHSREHHQRRHSLLLGRRRRERRRRHVSLKCRQFIKTQVTLINDHNHASSSAAVFNHQPVDFQRIYFRLRAQDAAKRDSDTRTWHWHRFNQVGLDHTHRHTHIQCCAVHSAVSWHVQNRDVLQGTGSRLLFVQSYEDECEPRNTGHRFKLTTSV